MEKRLFGGGSADGSADGSASLRTMRLLLHKPLAVTSESPVVPRLYDIVHLFESAMEFTLPGGLPLGLERALTGGLPLGLERALTGP